MNGISTWWVCLCVSSNMSELIVRICTKGNNLLSYPFSLYLSQSSSFLAFHFGYYCNGHWNSSFYCLGLHDAIRGKKEELKQTLVQLFPQVFPVLATWLYYNKEWICRPRKNVKKEWEDTVRWLHFHHLKTKWYFSISLPIQHRIDNSHIVFRRWRERLMLQLVVF